MLFLGNLLACTIKLEYLVVYGRASTGMPVGELQSTEAPMMNCALTV